MDRHEPEALMKDEALDELELLAAVEHAMVVDYLMAACVLGHELEQVGFTATTPWARAAAPTYQNLAIGEMFHLKRMCSGLAAAGRAVTMRRADRITSPGGTETSLRRTELEDPADMLARHLAAAKALDERYAALRVALEVQAGSDDVLAGLGGSLPEAGVHESALVTAGIPRPRPEDMMGITWRIDPDEFEKRLLASGDALYHVVLTSLIGQFTDPDFFAGGTFRTIATDTMTSLDSLNVLLLQRGLLPRFELG